MRQLALAAVAARILQPDSHTATARQLSPETASSSLGSLLSLGPVSGNEMLEMLGWLRSRQPWIEKSLAARHLSGGETLILCDVSSSCPEGRCCPMAAFGHSRDGKKGNMQITFGLLCAEDGCPVAVEVFSGNSAGPTAAAAQLEKLRNRFGIRRVTLVGDRGMITTARIRADSGPRSLDWIPAFRSSGIRKLLKAAPKTGRAPLDPEDLIPDAVAEISSPEYPGERLLVCLNPRLREERARKREALLRATEQALEEIDRAARRQGSRLRGREKIARRAGRDAGKRKVEKHFDITVSEGGISWSGRRRASRARPGSTESMSSGPASGRMRSQARVRWRPIKASRRSSGPSGPAKCPD